jgi:hypothetical protein
MAYNTDDKHGIIRKRPNQRTNTSARQKSNSYLIGWIILGIIVIILIFIISKSPNNSKTANLQTADSAVMSNVNQSQNIPASQTPQPSQQIDTSSIKHSPVDSSNLSTKDVFPPNYPNEQEIKSDLVGKNFGYWQINNSEEFKEFNIISDVFQNGRLYITIDFQIQDSNTNKSYDSEIWAYYTPNNGAWVYSGADDNYHRELFTNNNEQVENSTSQQTIVNQTPIQTQIAPNQTQNFSRPKANYTTQEHSGSRPNYYRRPVKFDDIITPFTCNCTFKRNTRLSTSSSGDFTVFYNVTFIINVNASFIGNIYLYKNATLIVNGELNGNVINKGGIIIQNKPIHGNITVNPSY